VALGRSCRFDWLFRFVLFEGVARYHSNSFILSVPFCLVLLRP
jgi:hypothetical protein